MIPRIAVGIVAVLLTIYALMVLHTQLRFGFDVIGAMMGLGAAMSAILCWWFATRAHIAESRRRMRVALMCGLIVGGVGFAAGFIGPVIFQPEANQGPLLGIFVTGPLGFVLGVAIGWLYARRSTARVSP